MNLWYRVLLRLYPASFREEYEEELRETFAHLRHDATGPLSGFWLFVSTVADIVASAVLVHRDTLKQDLAYTVRTLLHARAHTLAAIVVLALGIGASTAVFSLADYVLFRPLPFSDADRLVNISEERPGDSRTDLSPANYRDLKDAATSFAAIGAFRGLAVTLSDGGDPEYVEGASMTADVFSLLGAAPLLGRTFTAEDDRHGAPATLILSYQLWQDRFGGDPRVLGRTVRLDGAICTVIGVMPRFFAFPRRQAALWTPMRFADGKFADRRTKLLRGIARLRDERTLAQARTELSTIAAQLSSAYPADNADTALIVRGLRDNLSPQSRQSLLLLGGAALAVLLIACANVATLLIARAVGRRREFALRTALGGSRARVLRQVLTETTMLAVAGSLLGVLLASTFLPLLARLVPTELPIAAQPALDARGLVFALVATVATVLVFGLLPARHVQRLTSELLSGARVVGGREEWSRSVLVAAEIGVTVVLLIGSGLLLRTLWTIQGIDPGFRARDVLTLRTSLPMPQYEATATRLRFYDAVLSDVRALPGVSDAAYVSFLPFALRGGVWPVSVAGQPEQPGHQQTASLRFVTPGFFRTLQIPLLSGRDIDESDDRTRPSVAVVSESLARRYWPNQDPLGKRFEFASDVRTIIGVVGDIRVRSLLEPSEPQVYLSYRQVEDGAMTWYAPKDLVIRSAFPADAIVPAIRAAVRRADARQPLSNIRTLTNLVESETASRGAQLRVIAMFAGIAFLLAAAGIHGLLAYLVQQRQQEIGVRVALGARPRDIVRLFARRAALMTMCGLIPGVALACALGYAMRSLIVGVSPTDTLTFAVSVTAVMALTLVGSIVPLGRALRVDPLEVIRAE